MTATIRSEKQFWTPPRRLMSGVAKGRGKGRLAGGHVLDRADLLKALILCRDCLPKFDQTKAGYVTKANLPIVTAKCDGCQQWTGRGHLLVHHTLANLH